MRATNFALKFAITGIAITVVAGILDARQTSPTILTGDEQAIHDYVLTMDKVTKYMDVAAKLVDATKTDPALAAEVDKIGDAKVPNLEKVLMAQQSPRIAVFLKKNGMTERDFVMIPLTLFSTQSAVQGQMNHKPVPDFVNPVNIRFFNDHQREIRQYEKTSRGKTANAA